MNTKSRNLSLGLFGLFQLMRHGTVLIALFIALFRSLIAVAANPTLHIRSESGGSVVAITYVKQTCPASTVVLEMSLDLRTWNDATPWLMSPPEVTQNPDGVSETIVYRGPVHTPGTPERFFRAQIVSEAPIINFFSDPAEIVTNLRDYPVTGIIKSGQEAWINGTRIEAGGVDDAGNFAVAIALTEGRNLIDVVIRSAATGEPLRSASKTVHFDPTLSTAGRRLLYVDCVPGGGPSPVLNGTVVLDLDSSTFLGVLPNLHVRGITPDGTRIYLHDRTIVGTHFHQPVGIVPFGGDIQLNDFLVAPDGLHLFAGDEIVDVRRNELLPGRLPVSIVSGSSWAGAPVPGGPAITQDSRWIFCNNSLNRVDWQTGEVLSTGLSGHFYSDALVAAARNLLLISEYSFADGRLKIYNATTFEERAIISGLGDFAGQVGLLGDRYCVVGSAGNAAFRTGAISVLDLDSFSLVERADVPLADNLAVDGVSEIYASTGSSDGGCPRIGIDVFQFTPESGLTRLKTFHLGVNRSVPAFGAPQYDAIRRIVFKSVRL